MRQANARIGHTPWVCPFLLCKELKMAKKKTVTKAKEKAIPKIEEKTVNKQSVQSKNQPNQSGA